VAGSSEIKETLPTKGSGHQSQRLQQTRSIQDRTSLRCNLLNREKNEANYIQQMAVNEGYLVAKTVRTGNRQVITLPPPINQSTADTEDQKII
jgi:hypothetical protein